MFGPRFCNENLNVSFRVGGVTKQVPTNRAVALTYSLHFFHRLQELFSSLGIDFIFYRCDCRPFIGVGPFGTGPGTCNTTGIDRNTGAPLPSSTPILAPGQLFFQLPDRSPPECA